MQQEERKSIEGTPGRGWHSCKRVVAIRPDGQVAGVFDSLISVRRLFGFSHQRLCAHLKGHGEKTFHGLKWFYEKDYHELWLNGQADNIRFEEDVIHDRNTGHFLKGNKSNHPLNIIRDADPERYRNFIKLNSERMKEQWASGNFDNICIGVRCITDGKEFKSCREAARYYDVSNYSIFRIIQRGTPGKLGNLKGLDFEYINSNKTKV